MTIHANSCSAATTWVVSANMWRHMFWFLSRFFLLFYFLSLFLGSRCAVACRPILTIYTSSDVWGIRSEEYEHNDVVFGGPVVATPHLWDQIYQNSIFGRESDFSSLSRKVFKTTTSIPAKFCTTLKTTKWVVQISPQQLQVHKLADGRHFENVKSPCLRNCLTDFAEIWHDDAYWPHTEDRPLQSKISALVISKITKIAISQQWTDRSSRNLASWYNMGLLTIQTVKKWISKVQHGGRPPNLRNRLTDFDEIWHADAEPVS